MRKEYLYAIIGGAILTIVLLSGNCFGKDKHYIVKLKGNVLYAGHKNKDAGDKPAAAEVVVKHVKKFVPEAQPSQKTTDNLTPHTKKQPTVIVKNNVVQPVSQLPVKENKVQSSVIEKKNKVQPVTIKKEKPVKPTPIEKKNKVQAPAVVKEDKVQQPVIAKEEKVQAPAIAKKDKTQSSGVESDNSIPPVVHTPKFEKQLDMIHTKVFELYPGTYLDSVSFVNQLLSDSLRYELSESNSNERTEYLKQCLANSLQDSITLNKLSKLTTDEPSNRIADGGILTAHVKDASSMANIDSAVMDVFSGSSLVSSGSSDKAGTIMCKGIPEGNYYVVFSRKLFAPASFMRVKVSDAGPSYIDVPLNRQDGYLFRTFGKNAWLFIVSGGLILLSILIALAYVLAKFNAKRTLRTA